MCSSALRLAFSSAVVSITLATAPLRITIRLSPISARIGSWVEREVFAFNVRLANPRASIVFFNGITCQGAAELAYHMKNAPIVKDLEDRRLRFPMPSAVCPYCIGETAIGRDYQQTEARIRSSPIGTIRRRSKGSTCPCRMCREKPAAIPPAVARQIAISGGVRLGGLVCNERQTDKELELAENLAAKLGTRAAR